MSLNATEKLRAVASEMGCSFQPEESIVHVGCIDWEEAARFVTQMPHYSTVQHMKEDDVTGRVTIIIRSDGIILD